MIVAILSGNTAYVRNADIMSIEEIQSETPCWSEPRYVPHPFFWWLYRRIPPERTGFSTERYRLIRLRTGTCLAVTDTFSDLMKRIAAK